MWREFDSPLAPFFNFELHIIRNINKIYIFFKFIKLKTCKIQFLIKTKIVIIHSINIFYQFKTKIFQINLKRQKDCLLSIIERIQRVHLIKNFNLQNLLQLKELIPKKIVLWSHYLIVTNHRLRIIVSIKFKIHKSISPKHWAKKL